jgi:hypothetical protein
VVAAERTVRYWCKHTRGEVRFQGELINEEFDLEDPCKVVHDDGFSKIVVSHPWDGETFFGFYNQGLTLVEGDTGRFEGLAYKASSPHLEHTLTRDNVIRDEAFHKVMGNVEQLATGQLRRRVFESLEALEYDPAVEDPRREYWLRALLWHLKTGRALPSEDMRRPVLPLCGGARASIHETERGLRNALLRDRLLWSPVENPVTAHLREQGELVFHVRDDSYGLQVLHLLAMRGLSPEQRADADRVRRVNQVWCKPGLPEGELPAEVNTLGRALETMLREHGAKLSTVAFGHLAYPGSRIKGRVAITQSELGELTEIAESGRLGRSLWASRRALVVNLDHAAVADLVGLAAEEPELAAYKLIKLFFLGRELDVELAAELADIAWQQRWQR